MKPRYIAAAAVALVLVLSVALVSYDKDRGFSLRFSSGGGSASGNTDGVGGEASKSSGKVKNVSNGDASTDGTESTEPDLDGASTPSDGTSATPTAPVDGMMVGIIFWNDTEAKKARNVVISYGGSQFKPDVSKASDTGSIGPCPYGETLVLKVYPEGTAGDAAPLEFRFVVAKGMKADGDRDAIHVAMTDGSVRVLGNPVVDFSQVRAR